MTTTHAGRPLVSLVVPVYNEVESLATLHAEIGTVCGAMRELASHEIVFVNDGSTDGSSEVLDALAD